MIKKYEQPKTMIIRLPENIVAELRKMKLDKDLPTIGSALKFWIEQQQNEKIEARLNEIEEQVAKLPKRLAEMLVLHEKLTKN